MTRKSSTEGVATDTVRERLVPATEMIAQETQPDVQGTVSVGLANQPAQEVARPPAPAPVAQDVPPTARARYAKCRIEIAEIEQDISTLEDRRKEITDRASDSIRQITAQRDKALADIDVKLADATLAWTMATEQAKVYETAANAASGLGGQT